MTVPQTVARTVDQTQRWLKGVTEALGLADEDEAWAVLRGVLLHLRDRLPPDEAADLGAQLPTLVRGVYYEAWKPSATPEKDRSRDEFLTRVAERMGGRRDLDFENAVRVVFALLATELDGGEIDEVAQAMPGPVRDLWPASVRRRIDA